MRIRIVRPSSREQTDLLTERLAELRALGHDVVYEDVQPDSTWNYTAASPEARAAVLMDALTDPEVDVVWCARGGYGASEVLPHLDWKQLQGARPKALVGFSDVSALHTALYARLGWPGFHAPMPATSLWRKEDECRDIDFTFALLESFVERRVAEGEISVRPIGGGSAAPEAVSGPLFGGCFTVMTNLIGTRFFPQTLAGHILFLEDLDEHPGRLMRAWQQWILSGIASQLSGVVIGQLKSLGPKIPDNADFVLERFARFSPVPVFHSLDFGHVCPNMPLVLGSRATIKSQKLHYTYPISQT